MDVKQAIQTRRSIRQYKVDEVADDLIQEILEAGRLAPTGRNTQPQKFYIIKSEEDKQKLKEKNIFKQDFVYQSPVIIICCADLDFYNESYGPVSQADANLKASRDMGIVSAFMILQATELGLGSCYIGSMEKEKIKQVLNLPANYFIPYAIVFGYPDEEPKKRIRKNLEDFILK